jgi:ATP-dependent Clp protease ATP-binding subunit ClpC
VFQRFDDDARRVVIHAQEESRLLGHRHIGTEHLLLGLLHDDPQGRDTVRILTEAGVHPDAVRQNLEHQAADAGNAPLGHIPFTPHAKRTLEETAAAGARLAQARLTRAHLLVGLLTIPDATGVRILRSLGTDLPDLMSAAQRVAARSAPHEPTDHAVTVTASLRPANAAPSGWPGSPAGDLPAHVHRLMRERHRLAAALRRYGRHDNGCDPDQACTCGLGPILDEAARG